MHVTYASIVSVFSSKCKDHHAWNSCSVVLPIFEYCYLNKFCKPCQSMLMGVKNSYHNLASNNVRQNHWTLIPSRKWCVFIQLSVWSKWASTSSSGFPDKSGLKWDQFKHTTCCVCCPCLVDCAGCCTCCGGIWLSWRGWRCWNIWCLQSFLCHTWLILLLLYCVILYSILLNLWACNATLYTLTLSL